MTSNPDQSFAGWPRVRYKPTHEADDIVAAYGWLNPLLGMAAAFLCAAAAIRWLVRIVSTKGLAAFGWYRLAAGVLTFALVASRQI